MSNNLNVSINLDEISDRLDVSINFLNKYKVGFAEVRTIYGKNIVDFELNEVIKVREALTKHNLKVSAIASPLFKWYLDSTGNKIEHDNFSFNPALSDYQKKEYILKIIKIANIFDTKYVRVFSNLKQTSIENNRIYEDTIFEFMLDKFFESGIVPLLENEPVCLISKADDYLKVLQEYSNKGLKAWWDIANSYDVADTVNEHLINQLIPYIKYIHIKDKTTALEKTYVPLGSGYINYKRIFSDLTPFIEKDVFASIETHVHKDKLNATKHSLIYLNKILKKPRISYAIVGAGRVSKNHSRALKENINSELRGVFDIDLDKAKTFASINDIEVYDSLNKLLSDPKIQVVNICTPHYTHLEIAKNAINNNKVVLSEKPLAINSEKLSDFLKNKKAALNTYVVFQNLFNKPVQELLKYFEEGKFGKVQFCAANIRWSRNDEYFKDWHGKIKLSGGSLYNQAIHSIQLLLLLLGDKIASIHYEKTTTRSDSEVEDIGLATIKFKNGAVGYLELCLINKGGNLESSFYLVGTNGSMKINGRSLSNLAFQYFEGDKSAEKLVDKSGEDIYGNGHTLLIKALSNKLLGKNDKNSKHLIRAQEVYPVTKFIDRLYGSIK